MTTTELIKLLQDNEFGTSGRPRGITIYRFTDMFLSEAEDLKVCSSGDGCAGAELGLQVVPRREKLKTQSTFTELQELYKNKGIEISIQQLENMCNTFFEILKENKINSGYNIGEYYTLPNIYPREEFKVVGIREDEIEFEGDWSGGVTCMLGRSWLKKEQLQNAKRVK